jgi:hypothetical protein
MSLHQDAVQNQNIKILNTSFEIVAKLKFWGTTVTYQNFVQKELKAD